MADEARNVEILKPIYQRWRDSKGGSVDDFMNVCADNVAFGSLAQGAPEGARYLTAYQGRDALKEYFGGLSRDWDMLDWRTDEFIAQGDRVVVLVIQEDRQGGVDAESRRLAVRQRQGSRVLRVLRHRAGPRRGGVESVRRTSKHAPFVPAEAGT
jgi:ketosteroid isomerase-like protein